MVAIEQEEQEELFIKQFIEDLNIIEIDMGELLYLVIDRGLFNE
jgi:hypothetical protein